MATTILIHTAPAASNSAGGIFELVGHYVNVFHGRKDRVPTTVKLALVGLPRTGTGSLVEALTLLGYSTLHADEYFEVSDLFAALTDGRDPISMQEFTEKIGNRGFNALYYWNADFIQWAAESSDVKVILTARDSPKKWAESFQSVGVSWEEIILSRPWIWLRQVQDLIPTARSMREPIQSGDFQSLERSYISHERMVREVVPEDKLLVFNAKQGWGPLCEFLDNQCGTLSEQPFPHANERWTLQLENNILLLITWIWPLIVSAFIYTVWSVFRCVLTKSVKTKKS